MPLTIVTGRANAGKTRILHEAVERSLDAGDSPVLLLPALPDVERVQRELAEKGMSGVRIAAFDTWFAGQWAVHGDGRRLVSEHERRALVVRAIERTALRHVAESSAFLGFAAVVTSLVRNVGSSDLLRMPKHDDRLAEIVHVVESYTRLLESHWLVEQSVAMRGLGTSPPRLDGVVAVNRFVTLSEPQEHLIRGISSVGEVYVSLTWERGHAATEWITELVERLLNCGASHTVCPPKPARDELDLLEAGLFRPSATITPTGTVRLVHATGPEEEVAAVFEEIEGFVRRGVRPDRIAVAFRDPDRRIHLLSAAAAKVAAPVRIEALRPLARMPFGAALMALLDVVRKETRDRTRFLAFASSPYSGVPLDRVAAADLGWRRARLSGVDLLESACSLGSNISSIVAAALRVTGKDTVSDDGWKQLAGLMLSAARDRHPVGSVEALQDAVCHEGVVAMASSLAQVSGGQARLDDAIEALRSIHVPVVLGPEGPAVVVTEAHRLQSRRYEVLIVAGLSADEFSPDRPKRLAREIAEALGVDDRAAGSESERALFYSLVTKAARQLVLVDPTASPGGDGPRRSSFVDDVLDLYRSSQERAEGDAPSQPPPGRGGPDGLPGRSELSLGVDRSSLRRRAAPGLLDIQCPEVGKVDSREYTVSELETYLKCPFRWFAQYAARLSPIDVLLGPAETGTLAHAALAGFYRAWTEKHGLQRVTPSTVHDAVALLAEVWAAAVEKQWDAGVAGRYMLDRTHQRAAALIRDDAEALPGFAPTEHEYRFGASVGRPFEIDGCHLKGSVDRIDSGTTGIVVMDYKSGSGILGHGSFGSAGLLQLPVYAAVAARYFDRPIAAIVYRSLSTLQVRGAWNSARVDLSARGTRTDTVDDEGMEKVIAQGEARLAEACAGIRAGKIAPQPVKGACRFCPVSPVCEQEERLW